MAKHKVEITGINTANLKVLTSDEQLELFKKMQNGDKFAREDLINGNLKLVLSILRNFNNKIDNFPLTPPKDLETQKQYFLKYYFLSAVYCEIRKKSLKY